MSSNYQEEKREFTPRTLEAWIGKINNQFPTTLQTDWRQALRDEFQLNARQESSLDEAPPEQVDEIQQYFVQVAEDVGQGGHLVGNIVKLSAEQQTEQALHELHFHSHPLDRSHNLSIVIAHCDAHCRNWGWGPGKKKPPKKT
jgi:hypothetical protein